MTNLPDEMPVLQREVQRALGRCLLRLQQYERLLKAIVAAHDIAGPAADIPDIVQRRNEQTERKTLGTLVGELLESYLGPESGDASVHHTSAASGPSVSIRFGEALPEEDLARTQKNLAELVSLRNAMVHNFIDHHDLWTVDGCRRALDALDADSGRIDHHLDELRALAVRMQRTRNSAATVVQSDELLDYVVNGIHPDGTVDWSRSGIESMLREAFGANVADGWADLEKASAWIGAQHPDQTPQKYQCRSWPHVLDKTGVFELRYFETPEGRIPRYRIRPG